MHYSYQAKDSVTGAVYAWNNETPDPTGTYYPGPNSPTHILQTNDPPEGVMTPGRGVAVSDAVVKGAAANVTALRADPDLIAAGSIRLDCHTYPGHGGGDLYWDALSTDTDDNGTCFAVVGVATGRWKRKAHRIGPLHVDDFGAAPHYDIATQTGPDSTAAFEACWAAAALLSNRTRAVRFGRGFYKLTHAFQVNDAWDVRGEGNNQSILWFVTAGTNGIEIHPNHPQPYADSVTLKDFWIAGPPACGLSALELVKNLLEFDIDIAITGGWDFGFHSDGGGDPGLGAIQWGKMRLSSITSQTNMWAVDAKPHDYFYNRGYINACKIHLEILGSAGTAITLIGSYLGATYSELTGTTQGCGKSLDFTDIGQLSVHDFYSEGDGPGTLTRCVCDFRVGSAEFSTVGCDSLTFHRWNGKQIEDPTTFGTKALSHSYYWFNRSNLSMVIQTPQVDLAKTTLRDYDTPGNHDFDPPNVLLNGDFSRWNGAVPAGWVGNFSAERCGAGCVDPTRSSGAPNCVKVSPIITTKFATLLPEVTTELIGCYVSIQFKAKFAAGTDPAAIITWSTIPGNALDQFWAKGFDIIPCEDGFSLYASAFRVTQDMVTHGVSLLISATLASTFYLSEATCTIGGVVPRYFVRAREKQGVTAELQSDGRITLLTSAAAPPATDPFWGLAWQDGDRVMLSEPTARTYDALTGWVRIGGAWIEETRATDSLAGTKSVLTADVAANGTFTALAVNTAVDVLTANITGLAVSSKFLCTVGFRTTIYQDSDRSITGSVDETVDVYVTTDGSGVATCSIVGTQFPDVSRLHASLLGATSGLTTTAGGLKVTATRVADTASHAKARLWVAHVEDIT